MTNIEQYSKELFTEHANEIKAERTEFILHNLMPLPLGGVSILSSKGGVGKTFFTIKCALDLAINENIKIALWLSEDTKGEIKLRIDDIINTMNNKPYLSNIAINGADKQPIRDIFKRENQYYLQQALKDYKLVVLDPLAKFLTCNENDNIAMTDYISSLIEIAIKNNQAILLLHHHTKEDKDGFSTIRGASAIVNSVRLHYSLRYDKEKEKHILKIEKDNLNAKYFLGGVEEKEIQVFPIKEKEVTQRKTIKGIKWETETI